MSNIAEEVKRLNLPSGEYSVVGSGALSIRGIRNHDDIDLIVTENLYEEMKTKGWEEKEKSDGLLHIYKNNTEVAKNFLHIDGFRLSTEEVIKNSDIIDDVSFMSLEDLITLKTAMGREKDLRDIALIKEYLNNSVTGSN
jgi:hypothetical protein